MHEGLLLWTKMFQRQLHHQKPIPAWITAHRIWRLVVHYTACIGFNRLRVSFTCGSVRLTLFQVGWLFSSFLLSYIVRLLSKGFYAAQLVSESSKQVSVSKSYWAVLLLMSSYEYSRVIEEWGVKLIWSASGTSRIYFELSTSCLNELLCRMESFTSP